MPEDAPLASCSLSSVTIGPKNPMSIEDVKYFLIANGLETSKINIMKSESTYQ